MRKKQILDQLKKSEFKKIKISELNFFKRLFLYPSMFWHTINCYFLRKLKLIKLVIAKTFWGKEMLVVIPEVVSSDIYRFGFIESDVAQAIIKNISKNDVVLDVGAHFGLFTLLMSELVGEQGEVHSFEPVPHTFSILKQNVKNKKSIILNLNAAWEDNKDLIINDYGLSSSAFNSLKGSRNNQIKNNKVTKYINIKAIKLDDYVKTKGIKPSFIKIDAESAEYEVLKGMNYILKEVKPIICIELGDLGVKGAYQSLSIVRYLINYGYKPFEFKNNRFVKHIIKKKYKYGNLIFKYNQ